MKIHRRPKPTEKVETVTAIIPNYNYACFLKDRVKSIVDQRYPVSELIILDDHSTDDSLVVIDSIIKNLAKTHPKIRTRVVANRRNSGGVFGQWAKAFELASGNYVWICEADDLCSLTFLKRVMPAFKKDPSVVMSYANSKMIDENGRCLIRNLHGWADYRKSGHYKHNFIIDGREELANYLVINNTILNVSGVVFRNNPKIPFKRYLKTAESFRLAGDWYFYSKVLLFGKLAYNARPLNFYRSHSGSVSKETNNNLHYREIINVQDDIMSNIKISPEIKNLIFRRRKELRNLWNLY